MHDTPRVEANEATDAFEDGRGNRPLVEGTVARGWLNDDEQLYTGKVDGQLVDEFPFPVTREVLERGQQRFNVYCTPCHGKTGMGNGMIVQRGLRPPPSFHDERLRTSPVGLLLRRDDQRLRRDAGLPRAGGREGSLGDCGLHPRAAVEPARDRRRRAARQGPEPMPDKPERPHAPAQSRQSPSHGSGH